jgi:hypothetical protein
MAIAAAFTSVGSEARENDEEPGAYLSPLVPLQRLDGQNTHLHVDEVRLRPDGLLLQCSYTFGVVDARSASRLRYVAQNLAHTIPGDERRPGCVHLAWDGDVVHTTHRGNIRNPAFLTAWDIAVQACSSTVCLYSETDADGRFRFELPLSAVPFVIKTREDVTSTPRRAAALAPVRLSGRASVDMPAVYVPDLPDPRPLRPGAARQTVEAGDGLELHLVATDLAPPSSQMPVALAARRLRPSQLPAYSPPQDETIVAVYALHPFGARSRSPIAVKAPSTLPPGTLVSFRTIDDINGTFSAPVPGRATGTHVVTGASTGIGVLTHLVITAQR